MLLLQFQLGAERYVIDTADVVQVLPLVAIKPIPQAPHGVAGVFDFHGRPVPAVDLSQLMLGRPAERRLSTRVILTRYPDAAADHEPLLGLIAEKATHTVRRARSEFMPSGVTSDAARYLGPIAPCADGFVQWIEVRKLLSSSIYESLFHQAEERA